MEYENLYKLSTQVKYHVIMELIYLYITVNNSIIE